MRLNMTRRDVLWVWTAVALISRHPNALSRTDPSRALLDSRGSFFSNRPITASWLMLTPHRARLRLPFDNLAGLGSGEGRENRPRSRHCDRRKKCRKSGRPPTPPLPALFARKSEAMRSTILVGLFLLAELSTQKARFTKIIYEMARNHADGRRRLGFGPNARRAKRALGGCSGAGGY